MKTRRFTQGFTLLEVLVAMSLLTLLLTLTLSAFVMLNRTSERLINTSQHIDELNTLHQLLRDKISIMQPLAWTPPVFSAQPLSTMLLGESDSMIWISTMLPSQGLAGLHYLRIRQDEESRLFLDVLPYDADRPDWERSSSVELLRNVQQITLRYFHPEENTWVDTWEDARHLPLKITLQITHQDIAWPEWIIRLHQGGRS